MLTLRATGGIKNGSKRRRFDVDKDLPPDPCRPLLVGCGIPQIGFGLFLFFVMHTNSCKSQEDNEKTSIIISPFLGLCYATELFKLFRRPLRHLLRGS